MKKVITLSVMVLLCQIVGFSQNCEINLGEDQRTCDFKDTLVGIPIGGSWTYLCEDTMGIVSFEVLDDSLTLITFYQCGSYSFEYSISDSSCMTSDTIQIDFENPAQVQYSVDVGMDLEYQDYDCQQDTSVACGPFSILGEEPKPIWTFTPKSGSCSGNSFDISISDSISNCVADTITVVENFNNGAIGEGNPNTFCQTEILVHDNGEITDDDFFAAIFQTRNQGIDSLTSLCPSPSQCFFPPSEECIDSIIYDTAQLIIPVHLGGEWQVIQNNQLLPLDSNNVFTIDSTDYFLNVSPSPQTYAATFEVQEITPNGDTVYLSNPLTIDFQWVENWTSDTVQHIDSLIILKDSCCMGGASIVYTHDPVPPAPEYVCPPFSVEFIPALLTSSPNVICNDSSYIVTFELSEGIPPYQYLGTMGTLTGNTFTSDTIPISNLFYEFEFTDSGSCEETVSGEICPCLWGGNTPVYNLTTTDDCATNSVGSLTIDDPFNGFPPYLYSIDGSDFQESPFFENISAGLYELTLKDSLNCIITDEFTIENNQYDDLGTVESSIMICGNENTLLEINPTIPDSILQIQWDNGDTLVSQTVNQSGTYVAAIADLDNCTIYSEIFNVENIPLPSINSIKIPNVFTPNNDGTNDDYHPIIDDEFTINNYNLSIFNRWGQRVFHSTNKDEKWEPQKETMDVYVFVLEMELISCTGEVVYFKDSGDLTLIR